jgi:hypothetical protein
VPLNVPEGFGLSIEAELGMGNQWHNGVGGEFYLLQAGRLIQHYTNVTMTYTVDRELDNPASGIFDANTQGVGMDHAPVFSGDMQYSSESESSQTQSPTTTFYESWFYHPDLRPCAMLYPDTFDVYVAQTLWEDVYRLEDVDGSGLVLGGVVELGPIVDYENEVEWEVGRHYV